MKWKAVNNEITQEKQSTAPLRQISFQSISRYELLFKILKFSFRSTIVTNIFSVHFCEGTLYF